MCVRVQVYSNQQFAYSNQRSISGTPCYSWQGEFVILPPSAAQTWFNNSFPDWAIETTEANAKDANWGLTLRLYSRNTNNNGNGNNNPYNYASVNSWTTQYCDVFQVSGEVP